MNYKEEICNFCKRNNIDFEFGEKYADFYIDGISLVCKDILDDTEFYSANDIIVVTDSSVSDKFGKPNSTESNGLKYKNKCPNPLIGIDIELFKKHPKFPYDKNKPEVFYYVKVGGGKSVYDAFYNEQIRWKMIKNRILYSGGFIDAKQVLNALNITRTCKQPSWFSKSFAKQIIQNYTTSDTIVDPFAGWGARCDASKELSKTYIGCDLNKELVKWHNLNGRNEIICDDATTFTYNQECSVFICPPYQDIEVYFDGQNCDYTQCDWLKICMKNIPNALEYVMVCKVVDNGWEKFIVDTKSNKSHFGVNNEYILRITNEQSKSLLD